MTVNHPTNFFARQDQARKNCRIQIILFAFAVFIIVLVTTIAIRFAWYLYISTNIYSFDGGSRSYYQQKLSDFTFFDPAFFTFMAIAIVIVILAASLFKIKKLQKGGGAVAEMLGGRKIVSGTTDQAERRLVNVVEEMAIAAGIPVPRVYVLDSEYNINAFAAGLELNDAAVAVTNGALTKLNREELQGVIAHEFSHILNGDSRLNVQLIGILYGILFLGIAGRKFLSGGRVSLRAGLPAIAAGIFLVIIGYIGSFLGRLMQCAVSRQQELLADASAVQFTRNPLGLAGALKKIGGSIFGSNISSPLARQASHLFFSESHPDKLFTFLATHPPLVERIRLLDPSFDGKFVKINNEKALTKPQYITPFWGTQRYMPTGSSLLSIIPADVVHSVGHPSQDSIEQSQSLLTSIPEDIRQMVKTPQGAACIIFALLIGNDTSLRKQQITLLNSALVLKGSTEKVFLLSGQLSALPGPLKLPLMELALPSLSGMAGMEKRNFLLKVQSLIRADGQVSLFELSVQWILEKYLNPSEDLLHTITQFSIDQIGSDIIILLQALATAGNDGNSFKAEAAFRAGLARIPKLAARKPDFSSKENRSYLKVNNALTHLNAATFQIRESVIDACAHCAFADQLVTFEEGELLRVIALALQCPLPPFAQKTEPEAA